MCTKFKMKKWLLTENQIMCRIVVVLVYKHTFGALWTSILKWKSCTNGVYINNAYSVPYSKHLSHIKRLHGHFWLVFRHINMEGQEIQIL